MTWLEAAKASLLPLSREQTSFRAAILEWYYTGNAYDLEEAIEVCQLCGHLEIRYQFEVRNRHTHNELLVGSECITKFGIRAVGEGGELLSHEGTQRKVQKDRRKIIVDAQANRVINVLLLLASQDEKFDFEDFITYFQDRHAFTPNQLSLLTWRLDENRIAYAKRDFPMIIRRGREKAQLRHMLPWKVKRIWECMTPNQRLWYAKAQGTD